MVMKSPEFLLSDMSGTHSTQLLCDCVLFIHTVSSGRFVKQEQWERWQEKRKLVCVQAPGSLLWGPGGMSRGKI